MLRELALNSEVPGSNSDEGGVHVGLGPYHTRTHTHPHNSFDPGVIMYRFVWGGEPQTFMDLYSVGCSAKDASSPRLCASGLHLFL